MAIKRLALAVYFFISVIIVFFSAFFLYKYVRKWQRISEQRQVIRETKKEIDEFHQLGFADNSELIQLLQGRLQRAQDRLEDIAHTWMALKAAQQVSPVTKQHLRQVIKINKKMLLSYINDIKEYRRLGLSNSHNIIKFAHDKIVRLTIALAELERQSNDISDITQNEYIQRLARMHDINKQSIAHFKHELHAYNTASGNDAKKMIFAREQLTKKMRAMYQLERILEP